MVLIPPALVTQADIDEWDKVQAEMKALKAKEMLIRQRIYRGIFARPDEGTNKHTFDDGSLLKATRVIDRKVEIGAMQALAAKDGPFQEAGINANVLIKWTPELVIKEYRKLTPAQVLIFDQALIIKDGSPSLEYSRAASTEGPNNPGGV